MVFPDESTLYQGPDTELGVTKSVQKGDNHFLRKLFLKIGKVVTKIRGATGTENRFEVDTPAAVAVARGTQFRSSMDVKNAARFETLEGTVRVGTPAGRVDVSENEGVLVRKGRAPSAPVKLLPPPGIKDAKPMYKKLPLQLALVPVEGAASYRALLSRDEAGRDVLKSALLGPADIFKVSELADGTYYLQTTSIDANGLEGTPLKPMQIVLRTTPKAPFVQLPADKGEYRGTAIETAWLKVPGASGYGIQVSKNADFSELAAEIKDTTKTAEKIKLADYGNYFFRIRSLASDGYESEWSDALSFNLSALPPAPSMEKPKAGRKEVHLGWKDMGPEMKYHFQLARSEAFADPSVDKVLDKPEIIFPKPGEPGTYYVRVSTIDQKGEGDFSQPQILEIPRSFPYGVLGVAGAVVVAAFLIW